MGRYVGVGAGGASELVGSGGGRDRNFGESSWFGVLVGGVGRRQEGNLGSPWGFGAVVGGIGCRQVGGSSDVDERA